jgi:hypothetical protein
MRREWKTTFFWLVLISRFYPILNENMLFLILKLGDLNATNEANKLELKADHFEHVQDIKRQHEDSLEGERRIPCLKR